MAASISITVPSSAEEGASVPVSVVVSNTMPPWLFGIFKTEIFAVPDAYPSSRIFSTEDVIDGGSSKAYSPSFAMPDCNTTVLVWVERWDVDHYVYDKSASKVVSLEEVAPPVEVFAGSIARKELEYDEARGNIPVY